MKTTLEHLPDYKQRQLIGIKRINFVYNNLSFVVYRYDKAQKTLIPLGLTKRFLIY